MKRNLLSILAVLFLVSCNANVEKNSTDNKVSTEEKSIKPGTSETVSSSVSDDSSSEEVVSNFDVTKYINPDYQPKLDNLSEVSFYSLLSTKMNKSSKTFKNKKIKKSKNEGDDDTLVYPIEGLIFEFRNFLYFNFYAEEGSFIEEKVGLGKVSCLIVDNNFTEPLIVLSNNGRYFSCVEGGAMFSNTTNELCFKNFSTHKYIKDFSLIKERNHDVYTITCNFGPYNLVLDEISSISFRSNKTGDYMEYSVDPDSIYYENTSILCNVNELRALFGLEPLAEEISDIDDYRNKIMYRLGTYYDIPGTVLSAVNKMVYAATTKEEIEEIYNSCIGLDEKFEFYNIWSLYCPYQEMSIFKNKINACENIEDLIAIATEYKDVNADFDFEQYKSGIDEIIEQLESEDCYLFEGELELIEEFKLAVLSLDPDDMFYIQSYFGILNNLYESLEDVYFLIPCQIYYYNQVLKDETFAENWMRMYFALETRLNITDHLTLRVMIKQLQDYYLSQTDSQIPENINKIDKELAYDMTYQYEYLKSDSGLDETEILLRYRETMVGKLYRELERYGFLNAAASKLFNNARTKEEIDSIYADCTNLDEIFEFYKIWSFYCSVDELEEFRNKLEICFTYDSVVAVASEYDGVNDDFDFDKFKLEMDNILDQLLEDDCYLFGAESEYINNTKQQISYLDENADDYVESYFDTIYGITSALFDYRKLVPCQIYYYNQKLNDQQFVETWMKNYYDLELGCEMNSRLVIRQFIKQLRDYYLSHTDSQIPENINEIDYELYNQMMAQYGYLKNEE